MRTIAFATIALLACSAVGFALQQDEAKIKRVADKRKLDVEEPIKKAIKSVNADAGKFIVEAPIKSRIIDLKDMLDVDMGKGMVEWPIKHGLKPIEDIKKRVVEQPIKEAIKPGRAGKKVAPGKVNWHTSYEKAVAAAKRSGKPVLLFQLLGKLDDEFC